MTDFFTSDTHFGHENIIAYCKRPFSSVDEMNETMIRNWNAVVNDSDTVYHLGDFALGPKDKWRGYREALNGRIVFILGNHDAPRARFEKECVLLGDEMQEWRVYPHETDTPRSSIHLAHIPVGGDSSRGYKRAGMDWAMPVEAYFCGHVHDAWQEQGIPGKYRCINVGVDVRGFTPRTLEELIG